MSLQKLAARHWAMSKVGCEFSARVVHVGLEVSAALVSSILHGMAPICDAITCGIHGHVVRGVLADACNKALGHEQGRVCVHCKGWCT